MRQRLTAFAMIVLHVAALEYMLFRFEWFPIVVAGVALGGVPGWFQVRLGAKAKMAVSAGLAAFLFYGTQTFLFRGRLPVLPFLTGYAYPVGWYFLVMETALLFLRTQDGGMPAVFPVFGTTVMAYAGLAGRHGSRDPFFHAASMLFLVLTLLFWMTGTPRAAEPLPAGVKWRGRLLLGGLLGLTVSAAFLLSTVLGIFRADIDNTFLKMFGPGVSQSTTGFSTQARLGSVAFFKERDEEAPALRVISKLSPGYLRGYAYDEYKNGQWNVTVKDAVLPAVRKPFAEEPPVTGEQFYRVRGGAPPYRTLTVIPAQSFEGYLFAPLGTALIGTREVAPRGDSNGNLKMGRLSAGTEYTVAAAEKLQEALSEEDLRRFTALPADIDPGVQELAARLFKDCRTAQEKIAAVVDYFRRNYQYNLGIQIPRGKNPLTYFLLERPPAHCEYFATGAAVLLRMGGVPSRYVAGFVAAERNALGGYWLARNKNAHAWAEAYDDARGAWMTVEATVPEGVPGADENTPAGMIAQAGDWLSYLKQRVISALLAGNWRLALHDLRWLAWACVPLGIAGLWVGAQYARRRKKRSAITRFRPRRPDPMEKALLRLRQRMDREVRRCGFTRRPDEPVHAFADRIVMAEHPHRAKLERAATWYRLYNEVRFRYPLSPEHAETLAAAWREWKADRGWKSEE